MYAVPSPSNDVHSHDSNNNDMYVLALNESTESVTRFRVSGVGSSGGYVGGSISALVLAPNQKLYGIPGSTGSGVRVWDMDAQTVPVIGSASTFSSTNTGYDSETYQYSGGVLAPNGCIYAIPMRAHRVRHTRQRRKSRSFLNRLMIGAPPALRRL